MSMTTFYTSTSEQISHIQEIPINRSLLFFLSFPCCRGEAGQLSLPCTATFVIIFHCSLLLAFSLGFSSSSAFLRYISSHNPSILAAVFLVFCDLADNEDIIIMTIAGPLNVLAADFICAQ